MIKGKTEKETLDLNGWGVGDILEGTEYYGTDGFSTARILITAVGEEGFLGRRDTGLGFGEEKGTFTLFQREWHNLGNTHSREIICDQKPPPLSSGIVEESLRKHIEKLEDKVDMHEKWAKIRAEIKEDSTDIFRHLSRENVEKNGQISELRCENILLRQTVEFYADKDNWHQEYAGMLGPGKPKVRIKVDDIGRGEEYQVLGWWYEDSCGGKSARECLLKIDNKVNKWI